MNGTQDETALLRIAEEARDSAYCPYSNHPVGVALQTPDGTIFKGVNVETAHYKGTCAEASAISAMILAGHKKISAVAVVGPYKSPCWPCGDCRQRLFEFSDKTTLIHTYQHNDSILTYKLSELLPEAFGPDNLGD